MKRRNFHDQIVFVEYHRPENGIGIEVTMPIPEEIKGQKILVIEDIWDRGNTTIKILEDAGENSAALVLFHKLGVNDQIPPDPERVTIGAKIDKVWVGGSGLDFGIKDDPVYPKHFLRDKKGLWVRPDSL